MWWWLPLLWPCCCHYLCLLFLGALFSSSQGDELHPAAAPAAASPVNLHLPRCGVFCWARCGQPRGWAQAVVAGSVGMLVLWHGEVCAGQTPSSAAVSAAVSDH